MYCKMYGNADGAILKKNNVCKILVDLYSAILVRFSIFSSGTYSTSTTVYEHTSTCTGIVRAPVLYLYRYCAYRLHSEYKYCTYSTSVEVDIWLQ